MHSRQHHQQIRDQLSLWTGEPVSSDHEVNGADLYVRGEAHQFLVELKATSDVVAVRSAAHQLERLIEGRPEVIPLLAVPYMTKSAAEEAAKIGLNWLDLSGNADIKAEGFRILIDGKPNRFAERGRPSSFFAPKASRVTRTMLVEPDRWWQQTELATATRLSDGYVSKLVSRMQERGLVERRAKDRWIRPSNPTLLLDAWAEDGQFDRSEVIEFRHVGRSGQKVLRSVSDQLGASLDTQWAATGLAAAWLWAPFSDFRLSTFYVETPPLDPESLGLYPVPKGGNVWLVVPKDEGVFYGVTSRSGTPCVQPTQVYVDLTLHPERSEEAAAELRAKCLQFER